MDNRTLASAGVSPEAGPASLADAHSDSFPLAPLGVPSLPVLDSARRRGSLPTLDDASGATASKPLSAKDASLLSLLGASSLGATAEHERRYAVHPNSELGRGGIGRVFVALDRDLGRDVAIKELLHANDADLDRTSRLQTLARFLREARITGELEHPNIVPVYELGRRVDGTPYYAMRVVRGRTLGQALSEAETLRERLGLIDHFVGLCQAIAYAHSRGVVHRDVKPDNVMIGEFGETIVLDWGMAKVRGRGADSAGALAQGSLALDITLEGSLCCTPTHMSPEQARGALSEVDERSDVWALGVVLYTILAGRLPFTGSTLIEISERVTTGTRAALRSIEPNIPRELAAIADRALALDPEQRYANGSELLEDVNAYRRGAAVGAYAYSPVELIGRFLGRHRLAAVSSFVGLSVALLLAVGADLLLARARNGALEAERRATDNAQEARRSERAAKQNLSEVLVDKALQAMAAKDRSSAEVLAAEALSLVERSDARGLVVAAESAFRPEPRPGVAQARGCSRSFLSSSGPLACVRAQNLELFAVHDANVSRTIAVGGALNALAGSADGSHFVIAREDGEIRVYSALDSADTPLFVAHADRIATVAVSASGAYLAGGGARGGVLVWEVAAPHALYRLATAQAVSALAFAPDQKTLIVGGDLGELKAWDFQRGVRRAFAGHAGTIHALGFAQDGRYLVSAGADRTLRFWNTLDASPAQAPIVTTDAVTALSWANDGRLLAYANKDKSLRIVDVRNPERAAELHVRDDAVDSLALSGDGSELAIVTRDLGLELWSLESLKVPSLLVERGNVLALSFVPQKTELVSAGLGADGVAIWNLANGSVETRLPAGTERVRALAVSADGTRLAFAGSGPRVFLWDLPARMPLSVFDSARDDVRAVAFSPDGRTLAFAGLDRTLRVVDLQTLATTTELSGNSPLQALAFARSQTLWSGDREGVLSAWDLVAKRQSLRIQAHSDWLLAIAVTSDGRRIASAGADQRVKVWAADTGRLLADFGGHEGKVLSVAFSSDGRLLASGAEDKSVRIFDLDLAREIAILHGHTGAVRAVRFANNRPLLGSASDDGTIRLWSLETLTQPGALLRKRVEQTYRVRLVGTRVERAASP